MSHAEKSAYYQELKNAGVKLDRKYQQYTTDELLAAVNTLREGQGRPLVGQTPPGEPTPPDAPPAGFGIFPMTAEQGDRLEQEFGQPTAGHVEAVEPDVDFMTAGLGGPQPPAPQVRAPDTSAGIRQNTVNEGRLDPATGLIWWQDEIRKPLFPKPRERRVLRYLDPGVKTQTVVGANGAIESFEVAGDKAREAEVRITLPSYQTGIYTDPRFPFKIHVYNERRGFDLFEVQAFYGGADLVPSTIKRVYVENDLCYDIVSTVRAIQDEYRNQQLMKGNN